MVFSFGGEKHEFISVDVIKYEMQNFDNEYDANWLNCQIQIKTGGFKGSCAANILTMELADFLSQLQVLYNTLHTSAECKTLEDQIHMLIKGDGKGHMALTGKVTDIAGMGNTLSFSLEFDQTLLAHSIQELKSIMEAFPVRLV